MIQIASLVTQFGEREPVVRNILTLKSCAPISGAGGWPLQGTGQHSQAGWGLETVRCVAVVSCCRGMCWTLAQVPSMQHTCWQFVTQVRGRLL